MSGFYQAAGELMKLRPVSAFITLLVFSPELKIVPMEEVEEAGVLIMWAYLTLLKWHLKLGNVRCLLFD